MIYLSKEIEFKQAFDRLNSGLIQNLCWNSMWKNHMQNMAEFQFKDEIEFCQRKGFQSECDLDQLIEEVSKFERNEFIYLSYAVPTSSVYFTPYNLKVITYCDTDKSHLITMSKRGVTNWHESGSYFMALNEWYKEYELYKSIMEVGKTNDQLNEQVLFGCLLKNSSLSS